MYLKCNDCGHIFEDEEQARWNESRGECFGVPCWEEFIGCPLCRGDYCEAEQCEGCGQWFNKGDSELFNGLCKKCISEQISYKTFFNYCEENQEENYLPYFTMEYLMGMDCPKNMTDDFKELMKQVYLYRMELALKNEEAFGFLSDIEDYIMCDSTSIQEFAEWLNK